MHVGAGAFGSAPKWTRIRPPSGVIDEIGATISFSALSASSPERTVISQG